MHSGGSEATLEALERLYTHRYGRFLRVAEAILGDLELAREAVQEAFARLIRGRFDFRGEGALEGWVWRSVVNTAHSVGRERARERLLQGDVETVAALNGRVADHGISALVPLLPERQRLVLFLRYYADLDYDAIARALEIRPGTVGATLSHAHAALRRLIDEQEVTA